MAEVNWKALLPVDKQTSNPIITLLLLGNCGAGKSVLLHRFLTEKYPESNPLPTIGVDYVMKAIQLDGIQVTLQIRDTASQERFLSISRGHFLGVRLFLLFYSVVDSESFKGVDSWYRTMSQHTTGNVGLVLVATQCDRDDERKVSYQDGAEKATEYGMEFYETSSKTGQNVSEVFRAAARLGIEQAKADAITESLNNASLGVNAVPDLIANSLKAINSLTNLDLKGKNIGPEVAKDIATALKTNTTVTGLNLWGNQIGDEGAKSVAFALKTNRTITTLNVGKNAIGDDGCRAIAEALNTNTTLTSLDFRDNNVGYDGGKVIWEFFDNIPHRKFLNLEGNPAALGAIAVAKALKIIDSIPTLDFSGKRIGPKGAKDIAGALKHNNTVTSLNLENTDIGPEGALTIVQCVYEMVSDSRFLDREPIDIECRAKIPSDAILPAIPVEILGQSVTEIVNYLMTVATSVATRVCRSKLMFVGFANIGKTTLMDTLFSLKSQVVQIRAFFLPNRRCWAILKGNRLSLYASADSKVLLETLTLRSNRIWSIVCKSDEITLDILENGKSRVELKFDSIFQLRNWHERLSRCIWNGSTHGIDVCDHVIDDKQVKSKVKEFSTSNAPLGIVKVMESFEDLVISTWDFAGQRDYYNNHHYFLTNRAVYLVMWDLSKGDDGLNGLRFWFKSLAIHLPKYVESKSDVSIIVVGTHLNDPKVTKDDFSVGKRKDIIEKIKDECGISYPVDVWEVDSIDGNNVDGLYKCIIDTTLKQPHMGEILPMSYLLVDNVIQTMLGEKKLIDPFIPIVSLEEVVFRVQQMYRKIMKGEIQSALDLLHLWGRCVYFRQMSEIVVLSPTFVTQTMLARLFHPILKEYYDHGRLPYGDLSIHIFPHGHPLHNMIDKVIPLLVQFEVCFEEQVPSGSNASPSYIVVPSLLDDAPYDPFHRLWKSNIEYKEVEFERIFQFDVIPSEMVARFLARLHPYIMKLDEYDAIFRNGAMFCNKEKTAYVEVLSNWTWNQISVISGGKRKWIDSILQLFEMVLDNTRELMANYAGIHCDEVIHCLNKQCNNEKCVLRILENTEEKYQFSSVCTRRTEVKDVQEKAGILRRVEEPTQQPLNSETAQQTDVFLSHNWGEDELGRDNHARVKIVNDKLKAAGLKTWFDEEEMRGHMVNKMAEGIDNAKVVLVFVTKQYMEKVKSEGEDNCKGEFDYAINRRGTKYMIPIAMEAGMKNQKEWKGSLGFYLSKHFFVDLSDDDFTQQSMGKLVSNVQILVREA